MVVLLLFGGSGGGLGLVFGLGGSGLFVFGCGG